MFLHHLLQLAIMASFFGLITAVPTQTDDIVPPPQLTPRSRLSPEVAQAIQDNPDTSFMFPKNGTFELIQSLTDILAMEAKDSQLNPGPPDTPGPPGPPKPKKPQYKCACHCTLLFCGCNCQTLPLPDLPPGRSGQ